MPDIFEALAEIAANRRADPLAPVTVIAPSHAAALHLRRRLAAFGPFAAVRFEALPRVAELLGAGSLAAAGRAPLARPIADYVASLVARESRGALAGVGDLPGYARTLRQIFRRLRRGGILRASDVPAGLSRGHMGEILRLYDLFREQTAGFYDPEDLQDAAAETIEAGAAGALADIGAVYVAPPGAETAASARLLSALRDSVPRYQALDDTAASPQQQFAIAPDPASEVREVVRAVIAGLESGVALDEIAVFHGADRNYGRLLREAFASAGVACAPLPGIPLIETRAGRGVLALARLAERDFSRTATLEFLSVAPIKEWLPAKDGVVHENATTWDKLSRDAGITQGADGWNKRLGALIRQLDADGASLDPRENEPRIKAIEYQRAEASRLLEVIEGLVVRLLALTAETPAPRFIDTFEHIVREYIDAGTGDSAEAFEKVIDEIDQLGTVGAVGGSFSLPAFTLALTANLESATVRPTRLGEGVVVADYRTAAGLRFPRVILCGAYEGAFPSGPGSDALLDDGSWRDLKSAFPYIEDAQTRIDRGRAAAGRAVASAGDGALLWSAPAYEAGGSREYYPSPLMARAMSDSLGHELSASDVRRHVSVPGVFSRAPSPLATMLRGAPIEPAEAAVRRAVITRRDGLVIAESPALAMLQGRRGRGFTEWDGNLAALSDDTWLDLQKAVSPTSLETYASCGFKYFARSLLRLNTVEEPDDREMMDSATRGSLIHDILEHFFLRQQDRGRPQVKERWTEDDVRELLAMADAAFDEARNRGQTGLEIYWRHEIRSIRSDLVRFLEEDSNFREATGAVPVQFEARVEGEVAGVKLYGRVDRIDRTPDGRSAWVIDYKTGSAYGMDKMDADPLAGGTKLQLPTYLAAASDAEEATGLYWFISQKGDFLQTPYEPSPERDRRFSDTMTAIVGGVRQGAFPAVPGEEDDWDKGFTNCKFCDFNRICDVRRELAFANKREDGAMRPWHTVGETASPGSAT